MRTLLASVLFLAAFLASTPAYAGTHGAIGVTGSTAWMAEYQLALAVMRDDGLPIHDGCSGTDLCVTLGHYRASDGAAGYAVMGDQPKVMLNDQYDAGIWHRLHVITHEFGHIAGLGHTTTCDTSMHEGIPACGTYIIGYSETEKQILRQKWGT